MQLARASWAVLKADKELIALPVISLLATLVTAALFLIPIMWAGRAETEPNPAWIILPLVFGAYLVLAYIVIFFNAALVHAANERLEGGDPTIGSALRGAGRRAGRILPWALLSATVSALLRAAEQRGGVFGRVLSGAAGIAWSLVTFLVIPVLVIEDIGVRDALKRSGSLFRQTWGENIAARVGFGLVGFLLMLPGMAAVGGAFAIADTPNILLVSLGVLWMLVVAMVFAALSGIFQTALYRHAAGLTSTGAFAAEDLRAAFVAK
jgi:hypothetical protein